MRLQSALLVCFVFAMLLTLDRRTAIADDFPTARPEEVGLSTERLAAVRPALQKFVEAGRIPGAVVLVARRGRLVLREAVGWSDVGARQPMQADTVFRIYSMTKPVASVAVLMLVEEGKIDLDAPIETYLTELANRRVLPPDATTDVPARRSLTTRDLLRHTSGMTYGFYGKSSVDQQYLRNRVLAGDQDLSAMMLKLKELPLLGQPGERFIYSVSTDVLGRLVEVVSGETFDAFLQRRLFTPLAMPDTGFAVRAEAQPRFANNYGSTREGQLRVIDAAARSQYLRQPVLLSGGGGLVSTAGDYLRFCQMLLAGGEFEGQRYLRPETVLTMTSNQLLGSAYPVAVGEDVRHGVGFGLGVSVICEKIPGADYLPIGEYGWGGAASTHFWISPRDDLAVVLCSQYMPYTLLLENAVKPIVYGAMEGNSPQTGPR